MFELSKVFDAGYYSMINPDLPAAGLVNTDQLFNHFVQFGASEGRSFSPYVDLNFYKNANPDLAAAGLTTARQLLDHLITSGIHEKRLFSPRLDLNFYAAANQDLAAAGLTTGEQLFDHLINFGAREGRQLVSPPQMPVFPQPPEISSLARLGLAGVGASNRLLNTQLNSNLEPDINAILTAGLQTAMAQLKNFLTEPEFSEKMTVAFGQQIDLEAAKLLIQDLANGQVIPPIEIVSKDTGYNGAFDLLTNTIYISKTFLLQNANNPDALSSVLLEEIGHSVDSRVNAVDALGDEGEIFSALVRGTNLSQADLLALQSENDQVTLSLNGQSILVETSDSAWTTYVWDWNWNQLGGDLTLSKRNDGLNGVNVDWGSGSVMGASDYFITGMWNSSYFDANLSYKFRVQADDGFFLFVSEDGKNWTNLMNQWEFAYRDNQNYKTFREYTFTPNTSGYRYIFAYVFEKEGDASFDFSWDNGWDKNRGGLNYAKGDTTLQCMYKEMINNASSLEVRAIKGLTDQWWNPGAMPNALGLWALKVGPGLDWDHKPKLAEKDDLKLRDLNDYNYPVWGDSNREFNYDIWSNIHYGYVGKAAGFSDDILQFGASVHDRWANGQPDVPDSEAIKLGIELWNETGGDPNNLTPEKLRQKIISKASVLRTSNIQNGA